MNSNRLPIFFKYSIVKAENNSFMLRLYKCTRHKFQLQEHFTVTGNPAISALSFFDGTFLTVYVCHLLFSPPKLLMRKYFGWTPGDHSGSNCLKGVTWTSKIDSWQDSWVTVGWEGQWGGSVGVEWWGGEWLCWLCKPVQFSFWIKRKEKKRVTGKSFNRENEMSVQMTIYAFCLYVFVFLWTHSCLFQSDWINVWMCETKIQCCQSNLYVHVLLLIHSQTHHLSSEWLAGWTKWNADYFFKLGENRCGLYNTTTAASVQGDKC